MSTFARFRVRGPGARAFLDHVGSARTPGTPGRVALSLLLNPRGGIVGDLTITCQSPIDYLLVGPTLGAALYERWLTDRSHAFDVEVTDVSDELSALGLAGPRSRALLEVVSSQCLDALAFMRATTIEVGRVPCTVMRLSYTGELGYELYCRPHHLRALYDSLKLRG